MYGKNMGKIWEYCGNFESRSLWECSTTPQNIILDHVKIALPGGPVLGNFGNFYGTIFGNMIVGRWYVHPIIIPLSAMLHSLVANSFKVLLLVFFIHNMSLFLEEHGNMLGINESI